MAAHSRGRGIRIRGRGTQSLGPGAALRVEEGSQLRGGHRRTNTEDGTTESRFENAGPDAGTKQEESSELTKTGTVPITCLLPKHVSITYGAWW